MRTIIGAVLLAVLVGCSKGPQPVAAAAATPEQTAVREYVQTHFNDADVDYLEWGTPFVATLKEPLNYRSATPDSNGFRMMESLRPGAQVMAIPVTIRAKNAHGVKAIQPAVFYTRIDNGTQVIGAFTDDLVSPIPVGGT